MKRVVISLLAGLVLAGGISARPRAARQMNDLQKLLAMHQSEMQAFFCDVSFTNDAQVESFLRNVSASATPGQVFSQVSFTKFISVGGDMRSVSYNLVNRGGNVTFVKSANINGQMLKAVYEFDAGSRKLKAGTFNGKKPLKSSEYSI